MKKPRGEEEACKAGEREGGGHGKETRSKRALQGEEGGMLDRDTERGGVGQEGLRRALWQPSQVWCSSLWLTRPEV